MGLGIRLGSLFSEVSKARREMDSQGTKKVSTCDKLGVGRDTGKLSHLLATGWNQQFRDLPYEHLKLALVSKRELVWGQTACSTGLLGVPWWVYLSFRRRECVQRTSHDLVMHSTHEEDHRTNSSSSSLSPRFSHIRWFHPRAKASFS